MEIKEIRIVRKNRQRRKEKLGARLALFLGVEQFVINEYIGLGPINFLNNTIIYIFYLDFLYSFFFPVSCHFFFIGQQTS